MKAIECRALSRSFGAIRALDRLDLTVAEGSVYGFLGLNGAGKTTTIRLLTGMARPTMGEVHLFGQVVRAGSTATRRLFGYLSEEPAFYPWMTPRETLVYAGRLHGLARREGERRADEQIERVGLGEATRRRVGGFSRGMRQRLGLAAALIHRPPLLLLDEPASALDPAGRSDILSLIDQLRGRVTVFMSTHILADVDRVCDTVGILRQGHLVVEAAREELRRRYARPIVEVELDATPEAPAEGIAALARAIESLAGVEEVRRELAVLKVLVTDPSTTRAAILETAARSPLGIRRIEQIQPSIEDLFLRLTGATENQ